MVKKRSQLKKGEKINQVSSNSLLGCSHMEINSNREVIVDGCNGVLQYDTDVVKIKTGKLIVQFIGRGLTIKCLTTDSLVVEGFILSIEFIT